MARFSTSIIDFYTDKFEMLYQVELFRKKVLDFRQLLHTDIYDKMEDKEAFEKILYHYVEEAALTVSLIADLDFSKNDPILEVGGGIGLTYCFLKMEGYNAFAIEPSDSGYDNYFLAGKELFNALNVDDTNWYPLLGEQAEQINKQFKIIFSNNVLEHIINLEPTFEALKKVLAPNGVMVHNTVNYFVPYEPHYKMPLFPFFPHATTFFKPSLKNDDLWNGLNFITTSSLRKICRSCDLSIDFEKDTLYKTLRRLDTDEEFAKRQPYFIPIYKFLKATRLLNLIKHMPIAMTTPIRMTIKH